jgi:HK97 family phage portal protein
MNRLFKLFGFKSAPMNIGWDSPSNYVRADVAALPSVQRCMNLIANDVARCPLVVRDAEQTMVEDSTITALFTNAAQAELSGTDFRRWMATEALLSGNAFAQIVTDSMGQPVALRPLSSSAVSLNEDSNGVLHWTYSGTEIDYASMLHFKGAPSLGNPYWGTSVLSAAATSLDAVAQTEAAWNAYTRSGGYGKLVFSHPGALQPATRDAMRTAFMSGHMTAAAAGTPIFVGEGMTVTALSPSWGKDMIELRAAGARVVANMFGVPAAYLDMSEARTQPEIAQSYVSSCLEIWATTWEAEISNKLLPPGLRVRWDWSPVLEGDFRTAGRAYGKFVEVGVLSPNDVRVRLGYSPLPGLWDPRPVMSGVTIESDSIQ